jgi:hypothetical protein
MLILLKKPSDQKETLQKTISDVSLDDSNRVQTKLARKHSRHSSSILGHLQKQGVFQRNQMLRRDPLAFCLKASRAGLCTRTAKEEGGDVAALICPSTFLKKAVLTPPNVVTRHSIVPYHGAPGDLTGACFLG